MEQLLKTDGSIVKDIDITTLDKQQNLVGGLIQYVYLNNYNSIMIVNEMGLIHNLPFNAEASILAQQPIVGDVIIAKRNEIN